jgi:hypothetical protein
MATMNMFVLAWFKIRGLFSDRWLINEMFVLAWLIIRGLFSNRWLINEMFVLAWHVCFDRACKTKNLVILTGLLIVA